MNDCLTFYRYGAFDFSVISGARRKNATRETTSPLKVWLHEHRKNPYPTKGEKIMLAILTKMTLTQVLLFTFWWCLAPIILGSILSSVALYFANGWQDFFDATRIEREDINRAIDVRYLKSNRKDEWADGTDGRRMFVVVDHRAIQNSQSNSSDCGCPAAFWWSSLK